MACTVILELNVKSDSADDVAESFKSTFPDTRSYDGCIDVYATRNQDNPDNFLLVETWESREKYEKYLSEVDKSSFTALREIPNWGEIFSKNVFFASLKNKPEKNDFCRVVDQYLSILIKLSKEAKPELNEEIIQERKDYQKNYCVQQMKNEKTSMVLLKYFDEKWVNKYIKTVLFDF